MADLLLVVREGPGAGGQHPIEGELTIGREQGADLVLDHRGVSRHHARVWVEGDTAVVEDLGSSNGTFVNGEQIRDSRRLRGGDTVELGPAVLELQSGAAATELLEDPDSTEIHERAEPEPPVAAATPRPSAAPTPAATGNDPNLPALAAIVLGPLSIILLAFTSGGLFYISLPVAIAAIALGTIGRRKVDTGASSRHRGLATAGRVFGIVGAILAALILIVLLVLNAVLDEAGSSLSDLIDEARDEIENRE